MEVILEKYPYGYVESGIIELNGEPDYRIQKYNTYTMRYRDMYLCDNLMQIETDIIDRVKQVPIQKILQSGFR